MIKKCARPLKPRVIILKVLKFDGTEKSFTIAQFTNFIEIILFLFSNFF